MKLLRASRPSLEVFGTCPDIYHLILYYELETHQGRVASGAKFHKWIDLEDLCSLFLSPKGTEWPLLPALFDAKLCLHAVRSEQTLSNNCCKGAALPTFMTKQEPTLMRD